MEVAVKVLRRSMLDMDMNVVVEFEREISFMQRTRHSNLVRFFGAGRQEDDTPFLVEELMASGTLKDLLRGGNMRQLDWDAKTALATDVARGMAYMHGLGHIHRDLKSSNVLITEKMQAKVADFGSVGRLLTGQRSFSHDSIGSNLGLDQVVGTPLYMSLEMVNQAGYDASTDVWSFGVLMWEIAAQATPDLLEQEGITRGPVSSGLLRLLDEGRRLAIKAEWPDAWGVAHGAVLAAGARQPPHVPVTPKYAEGGGEC